MTPLQQASKNLLEIFYTTGKPIDVYVYDLRKALSDELAQAVEPAMYKYEHIYGYLPDQYSETQWGANWVENWLETKLYTNPAPPPAMHLSEILAEKGIKLRTAFEEKPRDHVRGAGKMINEPYDQQALELCNECGWKAIMPGDPCFVCNMQTEAQQVAVPAGWVLVPIEPTPAILDAMSSSGWKTASYKAMLAEAQGAKP